VPAQNPNEILREAAFRDTGNELSTWDFNNWRRAEIAEYKDERKRTPTDQDLASYVTAKLSAADAGTGLVIRIYGGVQDTTFPEYEKQWLNQIASVNLTPVTDQEFADLDTFVKSCGEAEKTAEAALNGAMSGTSDVSKLFDGVRSIISKMRETRLAGSKAIKVQKEEIKKNIISKSEAEVKAYVDQVRADNPQLDGIPLCAGLSSITVATARKKTVATMQSAVDSAVDKLRAEIEVAADLYCDNLRAIGGCRYQSLFHDRKSLAVKETDHVASVIDGRVAAHELSEERRKWVIDKKIQKEAEEERKQDEADNNQASAQQDDQPSLESFISEVRAKENQYAVKNWRIKHNNRVISNLHPDDIDKLDAGIKQLIDDFQGTPPPHGEKRAQQPSTFLQPVEEKVQVPEAKPEEIRLQFNMTCFCTIEQAKELSKRVKKMINGSPYIQEPAKMFRINK
jgi:hypothetical protein